MGKAIRVFVLLVVVVLAGQALALETQLAGIRLGQSAIELITNPAFLAPEFVGPVGLAISPAPPAVPAVQPSAAYGAQPVYQPPTAVSPTYGVMRTPSPTFRWGGRGGRRSEEEEDYALVSPGGASGGAALPSVPPSGFNISFGTGEGAGGARMPTYAPGATYQPLGPVSPAAATGAPPGGVLWLYRRPGNVLIVAEMNADAKITSITVQGKAYAGAQTSRGVRLGDSYSRVLALYGYPDNSQNEGAHFVLRYYDHGLMLQLYQMRVAVIMLTSQPMVAVAPTTPAMGVTPVVGPTPAPMPPGVMMPTMPRPPMGPLSRRDEEEYM